MFPTNRPVIFKRQENIVFADENYFSLIQYHWIAGSPNTSLQQPYQVVLTESNARLYFPKLTASEIIGKEIDFDDTVRTIIAGIVKTWNKILTSLLKHLSQKPHWKIRRLKPGDWDQWNSTNSASQLFIKLSAGTPTQVQKQIAQLYKKYKEADPDDHSITMHSLQPLSDLHFNGNYPAFDRPQAHLPVLYGLLAIAAFLLLLGCINFINLTTAQASQRTKEIGIRKTMGGSRMQLLFQFLSETFFITVIATLVSVAITPLLLKAFSGFIPPELHFDLIHKPEVLLFLTGLIIILCLLSGFYPAVILSRYKPVSVLKNQVYTASGSSRKSLLRKGLTVSQFVIAQVFIIATLLVSKQISYSLYKDWVLKKMRSFILIPTISIRCQPQTCVDGKAKSYTGNCNG